jgi:predicted GTPase
MSIKRAALGQMAPLGSLYDGRTDSFISLSLLRTTTPPSAVDTMENHSTDIKFSKTDTYKEKFDRMGVSAGLSASFLAGLVSVEGSGRYLTDRRDTNLLMQASMHYNITTMNEELNLTTKEVKDCLAFSTLETDAATHVVTGISWGARCVVTAKREVALSEDREEITGALEAELGALRMIGLGGGGDTELNKAGGEKNAATSFEVTIYGDVLADDGLVPTDFNSAQRFLSNVHRYIAAANNGKGKPLTYTLLPIQLLSVFRVLEIKIDIVLHELSVECMENFVHLFEDLREAQQSLFDYRRRVLQHKHCVPSHHIRLVEAHLSKARVAEATLKSNYASVLRDVRAGADAQRMWQLLQEFRDGESSPKELMSVALFTEKMDFVDLITAEGARYIGYRGSSLDTELAKNPHDDAFILFFNQDIRRKCRLWKENFALFLELLRDKAKKRVVIAVDCDAIEQPLESSYISQTRNSHVVVEDVLERNKLLANNCTMRFNARSMQKSLQERPLQRRAVKIPCPSTFCSQTLRCNWVCSECYTMVEYGYTDDLLYCSCGGCRFDQWEFKCKDPMHGSEWRKYDNQKLLQLLKALESFEELNILILGATGVGKSTWINAFINYLAFESLDEALRVEDLKWVIPCSFSTQIVNEADPQKGFETKEVKMGFKQNVSKSKSELDGSKGDSATQRTSVYAFYIGKTRLRLIDTPGIGDTRGVEQDNENMSDILGVLRNYDNLHGVLVLLKPNDARLNVVFRFCITQLLTHLHRNAAKNIVFGFTNTRGSNYKPGDTFVPLKRLLTKCEGVQLGLFQHNVYCFDSESFRYLAARKRGVDMGMLEDNRRSWQYSVTECRRLLEHVRGQPPHRVRSTVNLNETRHIIIRLSEPMALLAGKIQNSIVVNERMLKELSTKEFSRKQLEKMLWVYKASLTTYPVDEPRTVCANTSCFDIQRDLNGIAATIYKTMCHKPCGLSGVDVNTQGHRLLQHCAAMNQEGNCNECGHHWMDHMHVRYDYQETTQKKVNLSTQKDLDDNLSAIQIQQRGIDDLKATIKEFEYEYKEIQKAAIDFAFFLKRNSIVPYNDATVEYLDHHIDREKALVAAGATKEKLDSLEKFRAEYIQQTQILEAAMKRGVETELLDEGGVHQRSAKLFALKNYGRDLYDIMTKQEKASEDTYRETTYNVSVHRDWDRSQGEDEWEDLDLPKGAVGQKKSRLAEMGRAASSMVLAATSAVSKHL